MTADEIVELRREVASRTANQARAAIAAAEAARADLQMAVADAYAQRLEKQRISPGTPVWAKDVGRGRFAAIYLGPDPESCHGQVDQVRPELICAKTRAAVKASLTAPLERMEDHMADRIREDHQTRSKALSRPAPELDTQVVAA